MGIFSRMSDIVNANISAMLDKAEDPEKIVRLMIQEMEDTLVEVRSAAARAIADKKEINRKLAELDDEVADWEGKAELAVSRGRDDLARAALQERNTVRAVAAGLRHQLEQLDEGLDRLNDDIGRLQGKLADAKARRQVLIARHHTAANRLQVRKQLHEGRIDDALMRFEQFERKMENIEGRVESYDLGNRPNLKQEISNLKDEEDIEKELEAVKLRVDGNAGPAGNK